MAALKLKMESGWMNIISHIFCKVDLFHSVLTLFFNDTFTKFFSEVHIACMHYVIFPVCSYALTSRCSIRPYRTQGVHRNEKKRPEEENVLLPTQLFWLSSVESMIIWQFSFFYFQFFVQFSLSGPCKKIWRFVMIWGGIAKFAFPSLDQCMFSKPNYFFFNNILYDRVILGN